MKDSRHRNTDNHSVQIQVPRSIALLACILLPVSIMALGAACFWFGHSVRTNGSSSSFITYNKSETTNVQSDVIHLKSGPWGDLECQRITIEIPDEFLSIRQHEADRPRWFFKGYSREALVRLFDDVGLSDTEKNDLVAATSWETVKDGIFVTPSTNVLLSLSKTSRAKIYNILAEFGENLAQSQAYHWPESVAEGIVSDTILSPEARALFKKLSYTRGKHTLFADLWVVLHNLNSHEDKVRFEKAISRTPTAIVRLVMNPNTDVESLVKYWGAGGFAKDVQPVLEGVARLPHSSKLGLANLLPPIPSSRLYSFPFPETDAPFDCHWTSFNFFKEKPDPPTNNGSFWQKKLQAEYSTVVTDPRFGDLVMLARPNGSICHSCVFIADNMVYTKNGAAPTAPWILQFIPDLLEEYSLEVKADEQLRVSYYRKKAI